MGKLDTGLAGHTVVVTGGNANIGRGVALAFATEGANVVVVGRDRSQGAKVCNHLLEQGGAREVAWQACDVTDRAEAGALAAAVQERFGGALMSWSTVSAATSAWMPSPSPIRTPGAATST